MHHYIAVILYNHSRHVFYSKPLDSSHNGLCSICIYCRPCVILQPSTTSYHWLRLTYTCKHWKHFSGLFFAQVYSLLLCQIGVVLMALSHDTEVSACNNLWTCPTQLRRGQGYDRLRDELAGKQWTGLCPGFSLAEQWSFQMDFWSLWLAICYC